MYTPYQKSHFNINTFISSQTYCNIVAGCSMAMGLRFAGSANEEAFNTLLSYCQMFISLCSKSVAELCGKSTIETCIIVTLISLSMVSFTLIHVTIVL